MDDFYDIVIVGAGVCGLTAAVELSSRGHKKILVVEADREPGGRVKSAILESGIRVDTGAHWFHGGDANPFYQWAKARYDLGPLVMDTVEHSFFFWRYGGMAELENATERVREIYKFCRDPDLSLYDAAKRTGDDASMDVMAYVSSEWMAIDSPKDARLGELFDDPLGYDGWQAVNGLGHLMRAMELDASRNGVEFLYDACVDKIDNTTGGATLTLRNGREVSARQCMVTVSCGILQCEDIGFDAQTRVMLKQKTEYLQMGNLAKIIVPLKEEFFDERNIASDTSYDLVDDRLYIHGRTAGAPTLTIFIGGGRSDEIEAMDEDAIENFAGGVFRSVPALKDFELYCDGKMFKTIWRRNSLARGSYPVGRPGGRRRNGPFASGNIVFAGDAFLAEEKDSPGQMAGAFNSAIRALKFFA